MIIVRYSEIGLKGKNRIVFERKLMENIEKQLRNNGYDSKVTRIHGRIFVETQAPEILLKNVLGISSFSKAIESSLDIDDIFNAIKKIIKDKDFSSFRISTQRIWKEYQYNSMELNAILGKMVKETFKKNVNLENPDLDIGVEIYKDRSLIFTEKIQGFGGLPVGIEGKVISLISGGIDSPVAAFLMMKRGALPIFLHFKHNDEQEKVVRRIIKKLESYSPDPLELIVEDHRSLLENILQNLYQSGYESWTCVLCRYSMLKRAEEIAKKYNALGIVTGKSLGQVASQTLSNIAVENLSVRIPVFRPLIGFDKVEIEKIAREIGTFDLSKSGGCGCPFLPKRPITNASIEKFRDLEKFVFNEPVKKINIEDLNRNTC